MRRRRIPTDLATTTAALFFTRWVTHFCAPVFFLLTGTGAFLALRRRSVADLSRFLLTRGLWLILLELVVVRCLGWQFNFDYRITILTVLWALGWAMIVLSALVWLPPWVVGAIGAAMIVTHNAFDRRARRVVRRTRAALDGAARAGRALDRRHATRVFVAYPLIPWVASRRWATALGRSTAGTPQRRRRFLAARWASALHRRIRRAARDQHLRRSVTLGSRSVRALFTVLSFLNTTKYPPSLLFLLMTLGPALLFLRAVDGAHSAVAAPALVFGKVPMFYYVLHIVLLHLMAVVACLARYGTARGCSNLRRWTSIR